MKLAGTECQRGLQRESTRTRQPVPVILERRRLATSSRVCPQTSNKVRGTRQFNIRVDRVAHLSCPETRRTGERRIRSGRRSSSSINPNSSCRISARSARRSAMPRTNNTVAYMPSDTPASPRSTFTSVVLLMDARSAKRAVGIRRRRRASRRSCPNLRSARRTGIGSRSRLLWLFAVFISCPDAPFEDSILNAIDHKVQDNGHKHKLKKRSDPQTGRDFRPPGIK